MGSLLRRFSFLAVAALACTLNGCSYGYTFIVVGTVRSLVDGQPIPEVKIAVDTWGDKARLQFDKWQTSSDDAGKFETEKLSIYSSGFDEKHFTKPWYLILEKAGYIQEVVEITPPRTPKLASAVSTLVTVVYMRPTK